MPNVFDQFDVAGQNPFDQFDESPQELEAGLNLEELARIRSQQTFDPMTGSFLGPTATREEKAQFSADVLKGKPILQIPGGIIGAAEEKVINPSLEWLYKHAPTVVNYPTDQERYTPEERALEAMKAQITGEAAPGPAPTEQPVGLVTPESQGITPSTPALPMPAESEKGIIPGVRRFISPMTTGTGAAMLPAFEYRIPRALFAAASLAEIPQTVEDIYRAKDGSETREAVTKSLLNLAVARGLTKSVIKEGGPNALLAKDREFYERMRARDESQQAGTQVPAEEGGAPLGERGSEAGLQKETQVPLTRAKEARETLTADEADYLDEERKGMNAKVEVGPQHLPGNEPFAKNEVSTINRETGTIVINPVEFKAQLADIPPERRSAYVRSMLAEERNHLATAPEDADAYVATMSGFERALERRAYTGKWTQAAATAAHRAMSDRAMGYEAIRRRMQQLARMEPTEVAQAVGNERVKMEALNVLQRMVSRTMETLPRGDLRRAILEKVQGNLDVARFVAAGGRPSSLSRPKDQLDDYLKMEPRAFASQFGTGKAGLTSMSYRLAEKLGPDALPDLESAQKEAVGRLQQFKGQKTPDFQKYADEGMRQQFFNEAAKWRRALNEAAATGATTDADFAALEAKHGVGESVRGGQDLKRAFESEMPTVEGVKPLERQSGRELTATESLAQRLETPRPSSLRRPKAPKEHPELFLPPIKSEQAGEVERGGFRQPAAGEITQMTDQFFSNVKASGKLPSFEEFSDTLRAQFGSQVTRDSIYYAWQDSLTKHLMQATGDELARMLPEVGVKRDVAEALQPSERDPYLGKIPDVMNEEQMANQIEYVRKMFSKKPWLTQEEFKRKFGAQIGQKFNVPFQRRYAAIGAIMDKLTQKAGDAPEKPWDRKEIGPEDIGQAYDVEGALPRSEAEKVQAGEELAGQFPTIESRRLITRIPAEEAGDAKRVGELAVANAAVDATGKAAPPRTVSKNVMALLDRDGGVTLVSAWRDPRTGPKVTNPSGATLPSEKITDKLLKSWSPMVVMTLRDPVQKFHQKFESVKAFEEWFGDVGIEGTPGIKSTSIHKMPTAKRPKRPEGAGLYESVPPEWSPRIGEVGFQPPAEPPSPTAREISTLRARGPTEVAGAPRGTGPMEPSPQAPPHEPEMLSAEAQAAIAREMEKPNPAMGEAAYRTLAHREVPKKPYTLESAMRYSVAALREGSEAPERRPRRPRMQGPTAPEREPSSLRRANDETSELYRTLKAMVRRRTTKKDLPRILDGQERVADRYARIVGQVIKMVSAKSTARADQKEARMVRAAAKAVIASTNRATKYEKNPELSGLTPNGLHFLRLDIAKARTMADLWSISSNPVKRLWAPRWKKAIDRLEKEINYARDHWDDPELQRTVWQIIKEGKDEVDFENANGFDVKERAWYLPGRYEGEFWSDQQAVFAPFGGSRRLLGEQYRGGKRFRDMYEAIANGPYIPGSYDPAVLMESRIRSGRYRVAHAQAREMWKDMNDPETGKPIAVSPKMITKEDPKTGEPITEYVPPSLDYPHLVWPSENKRGIPLAVSEPYVKMIRSLSRSSQIAEWPLGREALLTASILKHGWLLVGDLFHYARLAQYGATLSGKRWWNMDMNYKGGFAALNWRRADLPEAVRKGYITQEAADWANGTIRIKNRDGTFSDHYRTEVAQGLLKNGLNASRVIDALYKDAIRNVPLIGEPWHKVIGPYNRWLFDKFTSGLMLQKAVDNFERLHSQFPERDLQSLTRDVVRDMNAEFGNMGRQGIFRNPTFRDFAQIFLLAPMWREGIIMKELMTYGRMAKAGVALAKGDLRGARYHMSTPVTRSMLRGIASYFILTQVMNLISRKQFTWQNPEKEHKMDAFFPTGGGQGFWLSPMSVFMEMTHDVNRLMGSRPRAHDVLLQIGANALGPVGKAAKVITSGEDEFGRRITTTPGVWAEAASQLAPLPLSFGAPAKAIGHKLAPELISPPRRGAVLRQAMGWAGMKVQPSETSVVQIRRMADEFVKENNIQPEQGWFLQATDAASYASLRSALANDDVKEARKIFTKLRAEHPLERDSQGKVVKDPIIQAMATWSQRPFTGSYDGEAMFLDSLNEREFEIYDAALAERQDVLNKYIDWYIMHSGE